MHVNLRVNFKLQKQQNSLARPISVERNVQIDGNVSSQRFRDRRCVRQGLKKMEVLETD